MPRFLQIVWLAGVMSSAPAHALCSYGGRDYAKTTIAREFRDSRWVVKARVEAADEHWANEGESWTVYTVRVLRRYKGAPSGTFRLFTFRDSGGFYLDDETGPDLNGDYLLVLAPPLQTLPRGVKNVVEVNYSCGQSRRWSELSDSDRRDLERLTPPPPTPARAAASAGRRG